MALLLNAFFGKPEDWRKLFAAEMPELDVRIWPDAGDPAEIDVAAVASLPPGRLKALPNLRMVVSLLAGAEALLADPSLPDVPIVRAGNPDGDAMMSEAALLHVLRHHRHLPAYLLAQQRCEWISLPRLRAQERSVGVMGLGAWLVLRSELTTGAMLASSILLSKALAPVEQMVGTWRTIGGSRESWRRVRGLLTAGADTPARVSLPQATGRLTVEGASVHGNGGRVLLRVGCHRRCR